MVWLSLFAAVLASAVWRLKTAWQEPEGHPRDQFSKLGRWRVSIGGRFLDALGRAIS
jgi:hypothetical protein